MPALRYKFQSMRPTPRTQRLFTCEQTNTKSTLPYLLIGVRTQLLEQAIKLLFQLLVLWNSDERQRFDCPRIDIITGPMQQNERQFGLVVCFFSVSEKDFNVTYPRCRGANLTELSGE